MNRHKTKVSLAYDYIMDNIRKGIYANGDRLVISKLSKELSISEIPVREAVRLIESDGYAQVVPNQGAYVSILSKNDLIHIFQIKGVLEGYASRLCVDHTTHGVIKTLYENIAQAKDAFEAGDFDKVSKINYDFHMTMYECIPNRELYKMIADLWQKWQFTTKVFSLAPERIPASILEHEQILKLLESHQYDALEAYVREHKLKAGAEYAKELKCKDVQSDAK